MRNRLFLIVLFCLAGCSMHYEDRITKEYFSNGNLKNVMSYRHGMLNGISREYYEVGTLKHAIHYKNGKIDGMHHTYFPNGAMWTEDTYSKGLVVSHTEYNEEGEVVAEGHLSER